MKRAAVLIAIILGALIPGNTALAQTTDYNVPGFSVDGGTSNTSTGGAYKLTGSVGQPDAGKVFGGGYTIMGGYRGYMPSTPLAPALLTPANGRFTNDTTPDMTWSSVTNGAMYQIQIDSDALFSPPNRDALVGDTDYTDTDYTSALDPNMLYYWRVRAYNSLNVSG